MDKNGSKQVVLWRLFPETLFSRDSGMIYEARDPLEGLHEMDQLLDALTISGTSFLVAMLILVLVMLTMYASAALFTRPTRLAAEPAAVPAAQGAEQAPAVTFQDADEEQVAAVLATLAAADIDLPAGGRIHIEKVSRRR